MNFMQKQDASSRNAVRPGRPRSVATQEAILAASLRLTERVGYAQLTIEGIAAEAGVGKQTVYRWWPSKAAVVLEAFARDARAVVKVRVTGNLEIDLEKFLIAAYRRLTGPRGVVFRSLLSEALINSDFAQQFYDEYLQSRVDDLKTVLSSGANEAEGFEVPAELVEMIYGAIWYRMATNQKLTPAAARQVAAAAVNLLRET
ncbi:TetR/AcrR family transcriptional regulator [Lacipirellula parvula]|uniref:Transcriptional regulator n=1 Tax=Lacipirellula parvula TaxID=2650471 RepID=A0A5K7XEI3_9BACT|nr:TetR/AcrR family transcriptional regulator [Lacipirellula parvula]BBO34795.1 transcriptional regulator [Lacipirellula parvula]